MIVVALVAAFLSFGMPAIAVDDLSRPIRVSPDGHFLVQPDGEPFFWLADTAWKLFYRLSREEADEYLNDRAAKGFTVIQAVATGELYGDGLRRPNRYGQMPFIDTDPTRPNIPYWEHVDWIIEDAARHGLRVALLPVWGFSFVSGPPSERVFDESNAEFYGRWIGARYRGKGVIWVLGGDVNPLWPDALNLKIFQTNDAQAQDGRPSPIKDFRPVYDAMAKGIEAGNGGYAFITYHITSLSFSGTAHPRTSLYFHDRAWLDMNMLQSSHFIDQSPHLRRLGADFGWNSTYNYEPIGDEYRSLPVRPVVDGEPHYEDHPIDFDPNASKIAYWRAYDVRNAAYHALFAGAAGHTYGSFNIWDFYQPDRGEQAAPGRLIRQPWQQALQAPGAGQMQYAKNLLLSRPYFSRIPDQTLIVGDPGEGQQHIGATRDKDGSYAMLYLPQGQSVAVDLSKMTGSRVIGWWFDPRTGIAKKIGDAFPASGQRSFTAPTQGKNQDWILVLDDEGKGFAVPGTAR
ncbi:MAG: glycoside hydrolase family 140 protein [Acidobacteria bacterium]|nr:glycoside hydrolase family 140 protein [Acidobacteriota bacterium]